MSASGCCGTAGQPCAAPDQDAPLPPTPHTWHRREQYLESKRRAVLVKKVAGRIANLQLAAAWAAWRELLGEGPRPQQGCPHSSSSNSSIKRTWLVAHSLFPDSATSRFRCLD
jgi:hypothetical protein